MGGERQASSCRIGYRTSLQSMMRLTPVLMELGGKDAMIVADFFTSSSMIRS